MYKLVHEEVVSCENLFSSYSGSEYDRYADRYDDTAMSKVRQQYWTAKQVLMSKLGKRVDDHLVASDAELDAKLQIFLSAKRTCERLIKCIERYQDLICDLAKDENSLGRFLKHQGKTDKTNAGKIMAAVGRAQSYTAQQRLALRVPLSRLYSEVEVFLDRAVADCAITVDATEKARQEYRGSLLWMDDVSKELDPDVYQRLEKYRAVQAQVRKNKAKFDQLKLACLQKIDLLIASRCNLFSQILTCYQNGFLRFWEKTSDAHNSMADIFSTVQNYEFVILKDLSELSTKSLANLSETRSAEVNGAGNKELLCAESLENLFRDSPDGETTACLNPPAAIVALDPTQDRAGVTYDDGIRMRASGEALHETSTRSPTPSLLIRA
ncbi:unnamed protein product [Soboliphyme baturini]|uniref:AH domain-containing protein n=1 Tax=Soboliphyme baturini TaxID=241478 RepID=A0A183IHJ8_9BILA|nr:unnamed protein product [Soboliphyme baturini]